MNMRHDMKKILFFIIIILLSFSGCVYNQRFMRSSTNETQYMKDYYRCESWASDRIYKIYLDRKTTKQIPKKLIYEIARKYFCQCMEESGYKVLNDSEGFYFPMEDTQ